MPMTTPHCTYCRPEAYQLFQNQLEVVDTAAGILRAAIAISMHELDEVRPEAVEHRLDVLARRVRNRVAGSSPEALLAQLHQVLFDEEGFAGNREDYYDSRNSYLPVVLERKRGIPVTLVLVYKCVANRLGLTVHGVNSPGHFLARVKLEGSWTLVDPFFGGQVLSRDEALDRIEQRIGRRPPVSRTENERADTKEVSYDPTFQPATHRDWLARILRNLIAVFEHRGSDRDVAAMKELAELL